MQRLLLLLFNQPTEFSKSLHPNGSDLLLVANKSLFRNHLQIKVNQPASKTSGGNSKALKTTHEIRGFALDKETLKAP